jgi:hypothetical protein
MEVAMNAIVANVLMREAAKAETGVRPGIRPFTVVVLFCGIGLLASLCAAHLGLDLSGGGF